MSSPTSNRGSPSFVNPFERQRSAEKVPTLATITPIQPLLSEANAPVPSGPSAAHTTGSSPTNTTNSSTWRNRAASIFQSISSSSSNSSDRDRDNNNSPARGGAIQLKSDHLQRERLPSFAGVSTGQRRPSYVPKYAARAHMSSMAGRSSMIGSEVEAEEQLRRGSRMMSVAFPDGTGLGAVTAGGREGR